MGRSICWHYSGFIRAQQVTGSIPDSDRRKVRRVFSQLILECRIRAKFRVSSSDVYIHLCVRCIVTLFVGLFHALQFCHIFELQVIWRLRKWNASITIGKWPSRATWSSFVCCHRSWLPWPTRSVVTSKLTVLSTGSNERKHLFTPVGFHENLTAQQTAKIAGLSRASDCLLDDVNILQYWTMEQKYNWKS